MMEASCKVELTISLTNVPPVSLTNVPPVSLTNVPIVSLTNEVSKQSDTGRESSTDLMVDHNAGSTL